MTDYTLAIEGSTYTGSVALMQGDSVMAERTLVDGGIPSRGGREERVLPSVAECLVDARVDVGGNASIEGLRSLWGTLKSAQPALFDGLRPIIAVREGQKPGAVELRLIAGPLPNASIAARLCAALSTAGQSCQPAVFDGQRLALQ